MATYTGIIRNTGIPYTGQAFLIRAVTGNGTQVTIRSNPLDASFTLEVSEEISRDNPILFTAFYANGTQTPRYYFFETPGDKHFSIETFTHLSNDIIVTVRQKWGEMPAIENARVSITADSIVGTSTATTNEQGKATLTTLYSGEYYIKVTCSNSLYAEVEQLITVQDSASATQVIVNVPMSDTYARCITNSNATSIGQVTLPSGEDGNKLFVAGDANTYNLIIDSSWTYSSNKAVPRAYVSQKPTINPPILHVQSLNLTPYIQTLTFFFFFLGIFQNVNITTNSFIVGLGKQVNSQLLINAIFKTGISWMPDNQVVLKSMTGQTLASGEFADFGSSYWTCQLNLSTPLYTTQQYLLVIQITN